MRCQNEKWLNPQPLWSAKRFSYGPHMNLQNEKGKITETYGFGRVDIKAINNSHSKLTFSFISVTGTKYNDTFSVIKKI